MKNKLLNFKVTFFTGKIRCMYTRTYGAVILTPKDNAFINRVVEEILHPKKHFSYKGPNLPDGTPVATRDVVVYHKKAYIATDFNFDYIPEFFTTPEGISFFASCLLSLALIHNRDIVTQFVFKLFDRSSASFATIIAYSHIIVDRIQILVTAFLNYFFGNTTSSFITYLTESAKVVYKRVFAWLWDNIGEKEKQDAADTLADAIWRKFFKVVAGILEQPLKSFNSIPPEYYKQSKDAFYGAIDAVPPMPIELPDVPLKIQG